MGMFVCLRLVSVFIEKRGERDPPPRLGLGGGEKCLKKNRNRTRSESLSSTRKPNQGEGV